MPEFPEWVSERQRNLENILQALLAARDYPLGKSLKAELPTKPGLYAISRKNGGPGEYLHAGVAKGGGLQRRIWADHCQGGGKGTVSDLISIVMKERKIDRTTAGQWIAENCQVRWVIEENPELLNWAEDYILSVLQPKWEGIRSSTDEALRAALQTPPEKEHNIHTPLEVERDGIEIFQGKTEAKAEPESQGQSFSTAKAQTPENRLREIQKMAEDFNQSLLPVFERTGFHHGGNLLLGRFYAESDRMYFGLNPGLTGRERDEFCTCLEDDNGFNRPFRNPEDFNRNSQFGREFQRFLTAHPDLDRWFNSKVTSAFLFPWRTRNRDELYKLNDSTKDKLFEYSSQLVWRMIEHHDAKVLVVVGLNGVHLFNELFKRKEGRSAWDYRDVNAIGRSPGYAKYSVPGTRITLLQIPRFSPSRRNVVDSMADWLHRELHPFETEECPHEQSS